jgi:hypothetical protein
MTIRRGFLYSKKGKKLNKRAMSRKALQKRERQINYFKSRKSGGRGGRRR